ncbi:Putrescine importer PuuP, partial [Rhizobium ruizarguesonis]
VPTAIVTPSPAYAAYSFLGFDAVSTLTEETRDSKRTMPKAILITALAGGLIFVVSAYITQLAHPGIDFVSIDAAATEIAKAVGGDFFVTLGGRLSG